MSDRWQDLLSDLRQCRSLNHVDGVRQLLDKALTATSSLSAQAPASVLQQLQLAREFSETDQEAALREVDKLLADVDDAEALLLLMHNTAPANSKEPMQPTTAFPVPIASPAPEPWAASSTSQLGEAQVRQQQRRGRGRRAGPKRSSSYRAMGAAGRGLPVGGTYQHLGEVAKDPFSQDTEDESFPVPLHLVPRRPRTSRQSNRLTPHDGGAPRDWSHSQQQLQQQPAKEPKAMLQQARRAAAHQTVHSAGVGAEMATQHGAGLLQWLADIQQQPRQQSHAGSHLQPLQQQQQTPYVALPELQHALAQSSKPLPASLQTLLVTLGLLAPDSALAHQQQQLQAAAAAVGAAGWSTSAPGIHQPRKRSADAAGLPVAGSQSSKDRQSDPDCHGPIPAAAAGNGGGSSRNGNTAPASAAASFNDCGSAMLPGGSEASSPTAHLVALLRQRGIHSTLQINTFLQELPKALQSAAHHATHTQPATGTMQHMDDGMFKQAVEHSLQVAANNMQHGGTSAGAEPPAEAKGGEHRGQAQGVGAAAAAAAHASDSPVAQLLRSLAAASAAPVSVRQLEHQQQSGRVGLGPQCEQHEQAYHQQQQQQQRYQQLSKLQEEVYKHDQAQAPCTQLQPVPASGGVTAAAGGGEGVGEEPRPMGAHLSQYEAACALLHTMGIDAQLESVESAPWTDACGPASLQISVTRMHMTSAGAVALAEQLLAQLASSGVRIKRTDSGQAQAHTIKQEPAQQQQPPVPAVALLQLPLTLSGDSQHRLQQQGVALAMQGHMPVQDSTVSVESVQLHADLVTLLFMLEPGSMKYQSIWTAVELLEGSEKFLRDVFMYERAAADSCNSRRGPAAAAAAPVKVQFLTRSRPALLDQASCVPKQAESEASALLQALTKSSATPLQTTVAGLASFGAQLRRHFLGLRDMKAKIEASMKAAPLPGQASLLSAAPAPAPAAAAAPAPAGGAEGLAAGWAIDNGFTNAYIPDAPGSSGNKEGPPGRATTLSTPSSTAAAAAAVEAATTKVPPAAVVKARCVSPTPSSQGRPVHTSLMTHLAAAPSSSPTRDPSAPRTTQGGDGGAVPLQPLAVSLPAAAADAVPACRVAGALPGAAAAGAATTSALGNGPERSGSSSSAVNGLAAVLSQLRQAGPGLAAGQQQQVLQALLAALEGRGLDVAAAVAPPPPPAPAADAQGAAVEETAAAGDASPFAGPAAHHGIEAAAAGPGAASGSGGASGTLSMTLSSAGGIFSSSSASGSGSGGLRIAYKGTVVAPPALLADAGGAGEDVPQAELPIEALDDLQEAFCLDTQELPVALAASLPSVLVVRGKRARSSMGLETDEGQALWMSPASDASQKQLQVLQNLSSRRMGLVVHLPNGQQLVLFPERDAQTGEMKVGAVFAQPAPSAQPQ